MLYTKGIRARNENTDVTNKGFEMLYKRFNYRDVNNDLLYQVCQTAKGQHFMRHPSNTGQFVNGAKGIPRVLYNLPELIRRQNEVVFLCQSEKDADLLMQNGFLATAHSNGYDAWRDEYVEYLNGRHVVLVQHECRMGLRHAKRVIESLAGKVEGIPYVMLLSTSAGKGTVQDWIDEDRAFRVFHNIIAEIKRDY